MAKHKKPDNKYLFGVSLSIKQCRSFNLDHLKVLKAAASELGIKRFRLMSYWDEIEVLPGKYDYSYLDQQVKAIEKAGGQVTLCLGVRQPRWPESHWPGWAVKLEPQQWQEALMIFIEKTINRYKKYKCIISWQLENEAMLKSFGENGNFDRNRLIREFKLVKKLDRRPIIMTTSTSWGIPFRRPIPDIIGFSFYRITFNKKYRKSIYQPWVFKLRAVLIKLFQGKPSFIHELQAEPWGPKAIWEMNNTEKAKSMDSQKLKLNISSAISTGLYPIDLWGLEWWYSEKQNGNSQLWDTVKIEINKK